MARGRPAARGLIGLALCGAALAAAAQPVPSAASEAQAAAPAYTLDPTHTFVHWEVVHMGTSTLRGRFDRAGGVVRFDAPSRRLDLSITVDTASVSSGVPLLDALLKGPEMLDVAAHPQAYFTARGARFEGDVPREIRGEFTLRGISQPLTLRALRWNCALNPLFRRTVCGGDFEGELIRSTFGFTHSLPFVADRVRLLVEVEGIAL